MLRLLAAWRFPDDPAARAVFLEHPPSNARLGVTGDEWARLIIEQKRRNKLARVLDIEAKTAETLKAAGDPRRKIAERLAQLLPNARRAIERPDGHRADLGEIERLCSRANMMALGPLAHAEANRRKVSGRKPRLTAAIYRACLQAHPAWATLSKKERARRVAKTLGIDESTVRKFEKARTAKKRGEID
jgi:hypothetical protein